MTNHPRRRRDRMVEVTEQDVRDLAELAALRSQARIRAEIRQISHTVTTARVTGRPQ